MPVIRITCPECNKKYYPEWFVDHPRPEARCYMCLTTKKFAFLENLVACYKNDTENLKVENSQLKEEVIQLKEEVSLITKSKDNATPTKGYQVVRNGRKTKGPTMMTPTTPVSNRFSVLNRIDQSEGSKNIESRKTKGKSQNPESRNKQHQVSVNEECTYVWSDSVMRGQGVAFAMNDNNKKRIVKVIPGATVGIITDDIKKSEIPGNSCLVVHTGVNDVLNGKMTTRAIMTKYKHLITEMKKKTKKCIVNGILPQVMSTDRLNNLSNRKTMEINSSLRELCTKNNVVYNNLWTSFKNKPWLLNRDGIHLSQAGVRVMAGILNRAVYLLYSQQPHEREGGNLTSPRRLDLTLTSTRPLPTPAPWSPPASSPSPSPAPRTFTLPRTTPTLLTSPTLLTTPGTTPARSNVRNLPQAKNY